MTDKVKQAVIEEIVTLKSLLTDWEIASLDADDIILDEAKRKCSYRNIIDIYMSIYDSIEKRCIKCGKKCFRFEDCNTSYREYFLKNKCATVVVNNSCYSKEMISIEKETFGIDYLCNEDYYRTYLTIAEYTMMVHSEIIRPIINFLKGETSQLIF
jgi:hypothetical protein